jgi:hypothetical protein
VYTERMITHSRSRRGGNRHVPSLLNSMINDAFGSATPATMLKPVAAKTMSA